MKKRLFMGSAVLYAIIVSLIIAIAINTADAGSGETIEKLNLPAVEHAEASFDRKPWTDEDVEAIARTLAGECYDDRETDKRMVAEVVLNRVSDEKWPDEVIEVVSAKGQFHGYESPARTVTENDRKIAEETLRDWHENGCGALSEYLFFEAGPERENLFRSEY